MPESNNNPLLRIAVFNRVFAYTSDSYGSPLFFAQVTSSWRDAVENHTCGTFWKNIVDHDVTVAHDANAATYVTEWISSQPQNRVPIDEHATIRYYKPFLSPFHSLIYKKILAAKDWTRAIALLASRWRTESGGAENSDNNNNNNNSDALVPPPNAGLCLTWLLRGLHKFGDLPVAGQFRTKQGIMTSVNFPLVVAFETLNVDFFSFLLEECRNSGPNNQELVRGAGRNLLVAASVESKVNPVSVELENPQLLELLISKSQCTTSMSPESEKFRIYILRKLKSDFEAIERDNSRPGGRRRVIIRSPLDVSLHDVIRSAPTIPDTCRRIRHLLVAHANPNTLISLSSPLEEIVRSTLTAFSTANSCRTNATGATSTLIEIMNILIEFGALVHHKVPHGCGSEIPLVPPPYEKYGGLSATCGGSVLESTLDTLVAHPKQLKCFLHRAHPEKYGRLTRWDLQIKRQADALSACYPFSLVGCMVSLEETILHFALRFYWSEVQKIETMVAGGVSSVGDSASAAIAVVAVSEEEKIILRSNLTQMRDLVVDVLFSWWQKEQNQSEKNWSDDNTRDLLGFSVGDLLADIHADFQW